MNSRRLPPTLFERGIGSSPMSDEDVRKIAMLLLEYNRPEIHWAYREFCRGYNLVARALFRGPRGG